MSKNEYIYMYVLLCFSPGLSKAQKTFSNNLREFKFECIGSQQTDDELVIGKKP